eukprot:UN27980
MSSQYQSTISIINDQKAKMKTFKAVKKRNPDKSLKILRLEFGIDLMDTFSFICDCSVSNVQFKYSETGENKRKSLCVVSRSTIQEKKMDTQITQYRRPLKGIKTFESLGTIIRIYFKLSCVQYVFKNEEQRKLFQLKLAAAICSVRVYDSLSREMEKTRKVENDEKRP